MRHSSSQTPPKIHLILDHIRSLYNVGAIFRTAEVFGVEKIWLIGYSGILRPRSSRDKVRLNPKIAKSDMGTSKLVPWEHAEDIRLVIEQLKSRQFQIVSLEQTPRSTPLPNLTLNGQSLALILGHELHGVSKPALNLSNQIIEIPQLGTHNSLNVTTACGIALYAITIYALKPNTSG